MSLSWITAAFPALFRAGPVHNPSRWTALRTRCHLVSSTRLALLLPLNPCLPGRGHCSLSSNGCCFPFPGTLGKKVSQLCHSGSGRRGMRTMSAPSAGPSVQRMPCLCPTISTSAWPVLHRFFLMDSSSKSLRPAIHLNHFASIVVPCRAYHRRDRSLA